MPTEQKTVETQNIASVPTTAEVKEMPVKKHRPTTPWKPATLIHIPEHLKKPGFRYRFCNTDKPGNIQKKFAEGWEVDKELSAQMEHIPTINDGSKMDGTLRVRELIVMKMPEEKAIARDEYFANRTFDPKKKLKAEAKQVGFNTYGEYTERR